MRNDIKNILLNTFFGFIISIVIGLLFYGATIFNIADSRSQLFLFGFYGALFYSMLKFGKPKEVLFIGIMIFIAHMILQGTTLTLKFVIRDSIFFLSMYSALALYKIFIDKYSNLLLFFRGFALSLFLGILHFIATLVLLLIFNPSEFEISIAIYYNAQYAALTGLGLGIGFDLFEKYHDKIFNRKSVTAAS